MTLVKFNGRPAVKYDNLFRDFFNLSDNWPAGFGSFAATPATNIYETPQAYHLELNVPGRNKEDFKLELDQDLLTISFEKKEESTREDAQSVRREFSFNSFKRSFTLDENVDTENVQARYENGILKIELPKKEVLKQQARQIAVN